MSTASASKEHSARRPIAQQASKYNVDEDRSSTCSSSSTSSSSSDENADEDIQLRASYLSLQDKQQHLRSSLPKPRYDAGASAKAASNESSEATDDLTSASNNSSHISFDCQLEEEHDESFFSIRSGASLEDLSDASSSAAAGAASSISPAIAQLRAQASLQSASTSYASACALHRQGRVGEAVLLLKKAVEAAREGGHSNLEANAFLRLGVAYKRAGKHSSALSCYSAALQALPASADPALSQSAYRGLADAYRGLGNADLAASAQAQAEAALSSNLFLKVRELEETARKLQEAKQTEGAVTALEAALDAAMEGGDLKAEGRLCARLGEVLVEGGGDLSKARDYQRVALQIFREVGDRESAAVTWLRLGTVLRKSGDVKQALSAYSRSLQVQRDLLGSAKVHIEKTPKKTVMLLATTLNNLGEAYMLQRKLPEAKLRLQEAIEMKRRVLGPHHLDLAPTQDNLGLVYRELGEHRRALECLHAALAARQQALGPAHREVAASKINLAAVMNQLSDVDGALRYWREAAEVLEALPEQSLELGKTYNNMAVVLEGRGELGGALRLHKRAMELKLRDDPQAATVADSLYNIAILHEQLGELEEAVTACKRSLAITTESLGAHHPSARDARELLHDLKAALRRR